MKQDIQVLQEFYGHWNENWEVCDKEPEQALLKATEYIWKQAEQIHYWVHDELQRRRQKAQDNEWLEQIGIEPNQVTGIEDDSRTETHKKLLCLLHVLPKMSGRVYQFVLQSLRKH